MIIKAFCFNPFYENTYIIYKESGKAWLIDPGCSNRKEEEELSSFINDNHLQPTRLLLTHAHIDHILGLDFIYRKYGLTAEMHRLEEEVLNSAIQISMMYGIEYSSAPINDIYIVDNQQYIFENEKIISLWTPGHSPGSICFYLKDSNLLIGGDVLFEGSIGRTDLPGGDYNTLIKSIKSRLYPLGKDVTIYPGHGGITSIGHEKLTNPFLNE